MVRSVQVKSEITEIKNRWVDAIPNCVLGVGRDGLCLRHAGRAELPRRQNHRNIRGELLDLLFFRTFPAVVKVPSHQIRSALKSYCWVGLDEYMVHRFFLSL
jgi:hypothetical protein